MAISRKSLEQIGISLAPERFEALVLEAVSQFPPQPADATHDLTPAEAAAFERGGFVTVPAEYGEHDPLARTAAAYAALMATSLSAPEAARLLGVDDSRIRQRLAARTLYGIKVSDGWRLPAFQFDGAAVVAGLSAVLPRLAPELHPIAVARFFATPAPELELEDTLLSPRDWLRSGHDPRVVAELADAL